MLLKQTAQIVAVERVILDHQSKRPVPAVSLDRCGVPITRGNAPLATAVQGDGEEEHGTLALAVAVAAKRAAHQFHKMPADREAQPRAATAAGGAPVRLHELAEDSLELVR